MARIDELRPIWGWSSTELELEFSVELSDRQIQGLAVAYELGFFDVPRAATTEDVAAVLGITSGPTSNRIRTAERRIFACIMDELERDYADVARPPVEAREHPDSGLQALAEDVGVVPEAER